MTARHQVKPLLLAALLLAGMPVSGGSEAAADDCERGEERTAMVERVEDDATLLLAGGERARLAGVLPVRIIEAATSPGATRLNRLGHAAVDLLREKLVGRPVLLRLQGWSRDRYERLIAQVFDADGEWLQATLIDTGLARAASFADSRACIEALLAIEAVARAGHRGLWRFRALAPVDAAETGRIEQATYRFALVEGQVASVAERGRWTFVNFGSDWKSDFTLAIDKKWSRQMREEGFDLAALPGHRIRVRGTIERWNGPAIKLTHKEQIELLDPPTR